jgi:hypothetical protein
MTIDGADIDKKPTVSVISVDFPDPAILHIDNTWYAFATNKNGTNVQSARSTNFDNWKRQIGYDVLPKLPHWVGPNKTDVWAPNVVQTVRLPPTFVSRKLIILVVSHQLRHVLCCNAQIQFQLPPSRHSNLRNARRNLPTFLGDIYLRSKGRRSNRCIWIPGPRQQEMISNLQDRWELIGFRRFMQHWPRKPTPLVLQEVASNGVTKIGNKIQLLHHDDSEGPCIDAPSIVRIGGKYFLFYSSQCWDSGFYDVKFATSKRVYGPYKKGGQLLISPDLGPINPEKGG